MGTVFLDQLRAIERNLDTAIAELSRMAKTPDRVALSNALWHTRAAYQLTIKALEAYLAVEAHQRLVLAPGVRQSPSI